MNEQANENIKDEEEVFVNDNIRREKSNLHVYIDEFFDMLTLYDDNKSQNSSTQYKHDYKGLLKATIDVFL